MGDSFTLDGHQFTVTEMDGFRVTRMQAEKLPEAQEAPEEEKEEENTKE